MPCGLARLRRACQDKFRPTGAELFLGGEGFVGKDLSF